MAEHPTLHSIPGGREDRSPVPQPREPLWREVLGQRLRELRRDQDETLAETAGRAGVSPQYLSEVERGRKEPSSEMIAALAGALGTTLADLTEQVAEDLRRQSILVRISAPTAPPTRPTSRLTIITGPDRPHRRPTGPVLMAA
ncbi:helix-turn-helix transcriptional regulator [Nocardia terpenica]|uniref:helix-turn-helix domain-containing protein n=1 Tax=Nocardia terpenica TaxID=455432 RepID=UPI0018940754|nr:helix-turn-helix transcriptional regulator [Nocardia terpenica]MBF6064870.1 helix-turn-helix transcriptional regulator [Nocardia terpenica]MBF6107385.1 helix-turn-helix transcriptional regulator [Nocardia terpenica]MBF6115142.1 helix-turn-helix transcriptional regulator [Nocardia terpenica]MBF6122248.1 helix-turn-helix transcriptional regulator [Nocardia terpenica]MBF6154631.1 helix-turn-helix transcriptional regulator [Nocardia terpenica]